ncbi:MAG TPA: methyl-accepting chemotaxis protein [Spirochaetota bacterium]|nr:methyl-accepting chemotaxis protein [Spirochaetota bacterium]HPF05690.1 methyl-accepting chemotaxis protein [Spirochaetota bacterium]HPJ42824.1 methyl-accepting chemotaxis protein [Spirochaetota bacterium]HPR38827.1 methyl-accepting chemotaxis protein [Spirochaetota bacterium]HRX48009.1 methyl-accepting chemotaxis protein [Spirochaetota bacterium]
MKWFNNIKVAYKVLICCLLLISLSIIIVFFSVSSMKETKDVVQDYRNNSVLSVITMDGISKNLLQARVNMFAAAVAAEKGDMNEVKARVENTAKLREENLKLLEHVKQRSKTSEENAITEKYIPVYMELGKSMNGFNDALKSGNRADMELYMSRWLDNYRVVRDYMAQLHELTRKNGAERINNEYAAMDRVMIYMLALLVFSLLSGGIITYILSRSVSKPVNKGLEFAQKLADGDLTDRIDLDQNDELGMLAKALNAAADNLEKLVSEVGESVQNLTYAVNDISTGNQNLSQRTSEQASSLEEIASTLEEATASIRMNSDNTVEANKIADTSSRLAVDGGQIVENTVTSINQISESGKKIGEIIVVINEIAFQTNLLALNAAVEAARAGDQGRGFAVVAGEVRNLAQRAGNSAKEIEALIKDSQEKIGQGSEYVNRSGEALREIIASVKEVSRIISEVTAATEEQKQGIDQINTAVMELDTMTQQNAALVEETASASEEMSGQAQELLQMMHRFKISEDKQVKVRKPVYTHGKDVSVKTVQKQSADKKAAETPVKKESKKSAPDEAVFEQDGFEKF